MKPFAVLFALPCVLAVASTGASSSPATQADGGLVVNLGGRPSRSSPTVIYLGSEEPIAKVRLSVPAGYRLRLDQAHATKVGSAQLLLYDSTGEFSGYASGALVVVDAARYAGDPAVQACAPGAHTAVWSLRMSPPRQPLRFLILVDRAVAPGASRAVLHICPIWPRNTNMSVRSFELVVEGVLGTLTRRGRNTWRAFVSPPLLTLAPDLSRTFEVRALEPIPHVVTLSARHLPKAHAVVLSGTVRAFGQPEQGADVAFFYQAESGKYPAGLPAVGSVTTNAAGAFSMRVRVQETTLYVAFVYVPPRRCSEPSAAPAGCIRETVSRPAPGPTAFVRVRRPTDPKLVSRSRDLAFADRVSLKLADLPPGRWSKADSFSLFFCPGFRPDLSSLTATGDSERQLFRRDGAEVSSRVTVYASEDQAQTAFGREARIEAARCLAKKRLGPRGSGSRPGFGIRRIREMSLGVLGDETRAFRIVFDDGQKRWNFDLVSFRRGRAVVHLAFDSVSAATERALVAKVSARARGG